MKMKMNQVILIKKKVKLIHLINKLIFFKIIDIEYQKIDIEHQKIDTIFV